MVQIEISMANFFDENITTEKPALVRQITGDLQVKMTSSVPDILWINSIWWSLQSQLLKFFEAPEIF